jgi:hypothetical protein
MEWLEIIKIRSHASSIDARELIGQVMEDYKSKKLKEVKIYNHAGVSNDLMVTLVWGNAKPDQWGSDLAQNLSQQLMRHGLVDHTVWIER